MENNPFAPALAVLIRCDLFDSQTGQVVKSYSPEKKVVARRFAEKKNMDYGAHRYSARLIWANN